MWSENPLLIYGVSHRREAVCYTIIRAMVYLPKHTEVRLCYGTPYQREIACRSTRAGKMPLTNARKVIDYPMVSDN